jgi:DNA invertase Pin-like site-specific DNA recombinase
MMQGRKVMDIYAIRNELKTKTIYDIPLRVTFYARVSTDSDEQLNSLTNQTKYYKELITKNTNWQYIDGYIDEGLSAATTKKRESFHTMIADAKDDKFDLIITKEITRFARNTLDSIQFTRELLRYGVCVFFQNDNINTIDEDSELRLTIMAGIAQDELRKLSSRIKFGHQQAIQNGVVLGNSRIWGYTKQNKCLVIDEEEAEMVRELFELYSTDEYSMAQIEKIFWEKGYRNRNGNKISHSTMSNTISNPKYKGYYVGNKVKIMDIFTKKQKFLPPDQWVMYKDETGEIVPAIVSEELWDKANEVLTRRSLDVKNRQNKCNHANLLTGKLVCTHCNASFYRKDGIYRGKNTSRWTCSNKLKSGAGSCPSFSINEAEMKRIIFDVFTETYKDADKYIDEYLELYKKTISKGANANITKYQKIIETAEKKKEKLLMFNVDGKITDKDFEKMYAKCEAEIQEATQILDELTSEMDALKNVSKELSIIKSCLIDAVKNIENEVEVTPAFVNKYIDHIFVTPQEDGSMLLRIKLFTSDVLEKTLFRTGHTSKNICPVRTTSFTRLDRRAYGHQITICYQYALCI